MRHKKADKRTIDPDRVYKNKYVAKFINSIMKDGKKTVAQTVFYDAMNVIAQKSQGEALSIFEKALQNVGPKLEVKARRIGGANYQVPQEVRPERKMALAIRWIIESARGRSSKEYHSFAEKLAAELLDASQNQGNAIKKRDNILRMAEANRAFAHFRW